MCICSIYVLLIEIVTKLLLLLDDALKLNEQLMVLLSL